MKIKNLLFKSIFILITLFVTVIIGINYVLPRVLVKLTREISPSTAADYGLRYDDLEIVSYDSLLLKGDFIYPYEVEYNEPTTNHSVIVLHPLKFNQRMNYPFLKHLNDLDVNFITMDLRAHGRSEGHLYTLGVKESKDISSLIDHILNIYPNHSFGIYSRGNTGNIALKAMSQDERIQYGIIESFANQPIDAIKTLNYDDVFVSNERLQNHIINKTFDYVDITKDQFFIDFDKISQDILLVQTEHNYTHLESLASRLRMNQVYKMYFPENPFLYSYQPNVDTDYPLEKCLIEYITSRSARAIENAKNKYFTPVNE